MEARCLAVTPRIEAMARIMDENCHVTAMDIALWQEAYDKDIDEYPSVGELIEFVADMRAEESILPISYDDYDQLLYVLGPGMVEAIGMEYIYPRVNKKYLKVGPMVCAKANYRLLLEIAYVIDCFNLDDSNIVQKIKWLSSDTRLWVYNRFLKRADERCRCIAEAGLEYYNAHHIVESASRSATDNENDEYMRLASM